MLRYMKSLLTVTILPPYLPTTSSEHYFVTQRVAGHENKAMSLHISVKMRITRHNASTNAASFTV